MKITKFYITAQSSFMGNTTHGLEYSFHNSNPGKTYLIQIEDVSDIMEERKKNEQDKSL